MKDLLIISMGHHASEMIEIVDRINHFKETWNLLGFINADVKSIDQEKYGYPVLGTLDDLNKFPDAFFAADFFWTKKLDLPFERLATLIDPSAFVSRTAQIGHGCVIYPHCFIGLEAKVGNLVFCLAGSTLNHHNTIEDMVFIGSGVTLAGKVYVEEKCYLGQACTVKQWIRLGKGSIIGMGSVVTKDVEPGVVMAGNPAKILRNNII